MSIDIEEIKKDLEIIDIIFKEKNIIWKAIPDNHNRPPNDRLNLYLKAVGDLDRRYREVEKKYFSIFSQANIVYAPPYDSSPIEDFLKFFLLVYSNS